MKMLAFPGASTVPENDRVNAVNAEELMKKSLPNDCHGTLDSPGASNVQEICHG